MPLNNPVAWSRAAARAIVLASAVTLVATSLGGSAEPASASGLGDRISANRYGQRWAESAMRTQDAVLARVKVDQKLVRKDLKRTRRGLKRNVAILARAKATLVDRRGRLSLAEDLYDDPSLAPSPEAYAERLRDLRRKVREAERRKASVGKRARVTARMVRAKQARLRSLKRVGRAAIARRESAEGSLAAYIVQMEDLAAARAENQAAVSLGAGSFSWPTTGRISQTYGCTGFRLNPPRGSCRHFHDGIDIVDGYGTPVRAVAVGVVAYAGWNPWDEGGRAWIVVIAHPDGWVSRYGHMIPGDKVRAGELVHTGQIIGRMGNTGRSTGTHLHLEMLRGGRDVNPLAYLPTGVVKIKVDKTTTKKGKHALRAKKQARKQARLKARRKAQARAEARRADVRANAEGSACPAPQPVDLPELLGLLDAPAGGQSPSTTASAIATLDCPDGAIDAGEAAVDAAETGPEAAAIATFDAAPRATRPAPAVRDLPGVPRSSRGTSPVPS